MATTVDLTLLAIVVLTSGARSGLNIFRSIGKIYHRTILRTFYKWCPFYRGANKQVPKDSSANRLVPIGSGANRHSAETQRSRNEVRKKVTSQKLRLCSF